MQLFTTIRMSRLLLLAALTLAGEVPALAQSSLLPPPPSPPPMTVPLIAPQFPTAAPESTEGQGGRSGTRCRACSARKRAVAIDRPRFVLPHSFG